MPVMDGFDASRQIKELDPQAAIVLITGFLHTSLAREVPQKDFAKVAISEPFQLDELKIANQKAVEKPKPQTETSCER